MCANPNDRMSSLSWLIIELGLGAKNLLQHVDLLAPECGITCTCVVRTTYILYTSDSIIYVHTPTYACTRVNKRAASLSMAMRCTI